MKIEMSEAELEALVERVVRRVMRVSAPPYTIPPYVTPPNQVHPYVGDFPPNGISPNRWRWDGTFTC